ncbi:MAG: chromate transporter [Blautia sp.]|nr:chromate transporter [Blautia sp.]
MEILLMMWEYFKVGLFAVGGGLATLPFIIEMSKKTGWFSLEDISTMVGVSESTPGPLGINMASYVGFIMHGVNGAICTVIGIITPSIIVIIIVAKILDKFKTSKTVKDMFAGLRPASSALIAVAALSVLRIVAILPEMNLSQIKEAGITGVINIPAIVFVGVLLVFREKIEKHPILAIMVSAAIGIAYGAVRQYTTL